MVESKLQMDKAQQLSPLLGVAGPRFTANHNIILIWHTHVLLIRPLRTESQITAYHSDIVDTLLRTIAIETLFEGPLKLAHTTHGTYRGSSGPMGGYPSSLFCLLALHAQVETRISDRVVESIDG